MPVAAAISVENLAKSYLVGHRADLGETHSYTALRETPPLCARILEGSHRQ
jgi:hypothetical protein